jgi:hypothetical protein
LPPYAPLLGVDEEPPYPLPVDGKGPSREEGHGGGGEPGCGLDIMRRERKRGS